jgi:hypothetical protein
MARMVSYPGITRTVTYVLSGPQTDTSRAGVYDCIVEEKRLQSLLSACSSLMPLWTSANRGCLAKNYWPLSFEELTFALKCFTYLTK